MSIFTVSPKKELALQKRMQQLNIRENDIEEKFVTSSGPGGQKINRSSTCVQLLHIPTGIQVKYQRERSQSLNRFFARRCLLDKIERKQNGSVQEEESRREKIRRNKRRREKRAKEKYKKT